MSQIRRRPFLLAMGAGCLLASLPAIAQQQNRVRRIGFFTGVNAQTAAAWLAAFRQGMLELRWVEGRDYVIDARYGNGDSQALPGLADELIANQPDLLLTAADTTTRVLTQKAKTIPIVFAVAQDPVGNGNVASLQRPGGNSTGLAILTRDLSAKRLQLLKEAFPRVAHVAMLFQPESVSSVSEVKEIEDAGPRLGMRVTRIEVRQPPDIEPAFKRGSALGAQAYIVTQGSVLISQYRAISDRIIRLKVPAIAATTDYVEAGGLMSYAASFTDNFRRAAAYVDKILKGAKPGDLPIEQPTRFELVVNMKTAKTMGITFPKPFLLRVDRVIE